MFLLLLPAAIASELPPGEPLDKALALHLGSEGLSHLGDVVERALPQSIPVTNVSDTFSCSGDPGDLIEYTLDEMDLQIGVQDVALEPSPGRLDLWLTLTLSSSASQLAVTGDCSFLSGLNETCGVELPVTATQAHIGIAITQNGEQLDVNVDEVELSISPIGNPLSDCLLGDAIGTLLNQDENALTNILMDLVEPELDSLGASVEESVQDALDGLSVDTDLSVGEATVNLSLFVSHFALDESGMQLGIGAQVEPTELSNCVVPNEGSPFHDAAWPDFNETAWDTSLPVDISLFVNRDFLDHTAWVLWAAGALCYSLDSLEGQPTSTDLFSTFVAGGFPDLFTQKEPVRLGFAPDQPPVFKFHEDGAPFSLQIPGLKVELYAALNQRMARIFQLSADTELGLDPGLTAESFAPEILWEEGGIPFSESWNEILEPGFAAGLYEVLNTLLTSTLLPDDLLPSMNLPSLFGAKLESIFWLPSADGQWQGGFARIDVAAVQPLQSPGCSGGSLGCDGGDSDLDLELLLGCSESGSGCSDSEGCGSEGGCDDTGCATGPRVPPRLLLGFFCIGLALARRRT